MVNKEYNSMRNHLSMNMSIMQSTTQTRCQNSMSAPNHACGAAAASFLDSWCGRPDVPLSAVFVIGPGTSLHQAMYLLFRDGGDYTKCITELSRNS